MKLNFLYPYIFYFLLNITTYLIVRETSDNINIPYSFYKIYNIILSLLSISSFLLLIRTKQDAGEIEINTKGTLKNIK